MSLSKSHEEQSKALCRVCQSAHKLLVEDQLTRGVPAREVSRMLAERGETISDKSLRNHFAKHAWREVERDPLVQAVIDQLRDEMEDQPVILKPLYVTAIRNLEQLDHTKPSQETIVRSVKEIMAIKGSELEREMLQNVAERMAQRSRDKAANVVSLRKEA